MAALFIVLLAFPGRLGEVTRSVLVDAFTAVSSFVAAALLLFYGLERVFEVDIRAKLRHAKSLQVPFAAALGATPGCGGAIIVVAAYSSGHVTFGAVVATLTATMGDAAFLLLATRPDAAAIVLPVALVVGVASGWFVDRFLPMLGAAPRSALPPAPSTGRVGWKHRLSVTFCAAGLIVGVLELLAVDVAAAVGDAWLAALATSGTLALLLVWITSPLRAVASVDDPPVVRTAEETAFVSVWILAAFLAYEYLVSFAGLELELWFQGAAPLLPFIAVAVGFIPGCGPQVLVASLFIQGVVPFAALIGNAISNDGDALFPAIALERRAALVATAVTAVPAIVVAYAFYFLLPVLR
ncbi:MAG: putative manganese transporter [Myxococcota bacterium]